MLKHAFVFRFSSPVVQSRKFLGIVFVLLLPGLGCAFSGPKYVIRDPITLTIEPTTAVLTTGHMMKFGHRISSPFGTNVSWSVPDANGGSVDNEGHYLAPDVPGIYRVQVASASDPSKTAVSEVTVVAAPKGPITAPEKVESGASGLIASVPFIAGTTYSWTIEGGSLQSDSTKSEVRFSVGWEPKVVLGCRIVNVAGDALTLTQEVLKTAPIVFRLDPTSVTLTVEGSIHFGYFLSGGIRPSLMWSVPDPSHGYVDQNGNYRAPRIPGRYIVRAMPDVAPEKAATVDVNVVQRPVGAIIGPYGVKSGTSGLVATVSARQGLKFEWSIVGGQITGPIDGKSITFSSGQDPELVLSCKLTNEAGDTFTTHRQIPVQTRK